MFLQYSRVKAHRVYRMGLKIIQFRKKRSKFLLIHKKQTFFWFLSQECLIFSPFAKINNIKFIRQFVLLRFNFIFFPKQIQTYFLQIKYRLKLYKVIQIRFLWNLYWGIFQYQLNYQPTRFTLQIFSIYKPFLLHFGEFPPSLNR